MHLLSTLKDTIFTDKNAFISIISGLIAILIGVLKDKIKAVFDVSVHSPPLFPGSAAILAAISAGETPAIPGGSEHLHWQAMDQY